MDTKTPTPPTPPTHPAPDANKHNPEDVVYNVMPTDAKSGTFSAPPPNPSEPGSSRKWMYIIIAVVILAGLGAAAYYMLGSNTTPKETENTSSLPKTWLTEYFNTEVCVNEEVCGENADPDKDGLGNLDEFRQGTNPLNPDSDEDGLADGDEINIFKTDPKLKYTDRRQTVIENDWTDGFQLKNGFDPLTPSLAVTETRKQQIESAINEFGLHEPSISTFVGFWLDPNYVEPVESEE